MEIPVDEILIKKLYAKYKKSIPDQATIDQINEKYGEDNRSFARDFYLENVEEAKDDNWLEGKLENVDKKYPSTSTTEPEEEVKKKEEITVSDGQPEETTTTSDTEPPTEETPVSDISDSEEEKETPESHQIGHTVTNPEYDKRYPSDSPQNQGIPKTITVFEQTYLSPVDGLGEIDYSTYTNEGTFTAPPIHPLDPGITYSIAELFTPGEYTEPTSRETYDASKTQSRDQYNQGMGKQMTLSNQYEREVLMNDATILGGKELQKEAFNITLLYNEHELLSDDYSKSADELATMSLATDVSTQDLIDAQQDHVIGGYSPTQQTMLLMDYENTDELRRNVRWNGLIGLLDEEERHSIRNSAQLTEKLLEKGYNQFQIDNLIEGAAIKTIDYIDDNITNLGNRYRSDKEIEVADAFNSFQDSSRELYVAANNLDNYYDFNDETKEKVDNLYQSKYGKSYTEFWNERTTFMENRLKYYAAAYQEATSKGSDQMYSVTTGEIINKKKATKADIIYNENINEGAERLIQKYNNDVYKLLQARRDAYFELMFAGQQLFKYQSASVKNQGPVDQFWGILLGTGPIKLDLVDPKIKGMPLSFTDAMNETWFTLATVYNSEFYDNPKDAFYYKYAKEDTPKGQFYSNKLNIHPVDDPLGRLYNQKLQNFQMIDRALVLNKNPILEAESNPEGYTDIFKRGFKQGTGQAVEKSAKAQARDFMDFMENYTGIKFTDEMAKKVEDTWTEELVHEGGAILPFLIELAGIAAVTEGAGIGPAIDAYFTTRAAQYSSAIWSGMTKAIGNGVKMSVEMEAHKQLMDGDMGGVEGFVLGTTGSLLPVWAAPILNSKPFARIPNLINRTIDANISITGGVIGMNSLELIENLQHGVPQLDENGEPVLDENDNPVIDYTFGEAIAQTFSGDEGFLLKQAKLYILTAGINLTKPRPIYQKWRQALLRDIRHQYGKQYANLPPEIREFYDNHDLPRDASEDQIREAYLNEAEVLNAQNQQKINKLNKDLKDAYDRGDKSEVDRLRDEINKAKNEEMSQFNDLTDKYNKAKKHQTEKAQLEDFLKESDRINKQQEKNGERYNKLDKMADNIENPPKKETEYKYNPQTEQMEPVLKLNEGPEPLTAKEAEYWADQTPGELRDSFKYIDENMDPFTGQQLKEQIQDGIKRKRSTDITNNPQDQQRAYDILTDISQLQFAKDMIQNESDPILSEPEIQKIDAEIDRLNNELKEIANREETGEAPPAQPGAGVAGGGGVDQPTSPKSTDPVVNLSKELDALHAERQDLKYNNQDLTEVNQKIAQKETELENAFKEADKEFTTEINRDGDKKYVDLSEGAEGKHKAPEQPETDPQSLTETQQFPTPKERGVTVEDEINRIQEEGNDAAREKATNENKIKRLEKDIKEEESKKGANPLSKKNREANKNIKEDQQKIDDLKKRNEEITAQNQERANELEELKSGKRDDEFYQEGEVPVVQETTEPVKEGDLFTKGEGTGQKEEAPKTEDEVVGKIKTEKEDILKEEGDYLDAIGKKLQEMAEGRKIEESIEEGRKEMAEARNKITQVEEAVKEGKLTEKEVEEAINKYEGDINKTLSDLVELSEAPNLERVYEQIEGIADRVKKRNPGRTDAEIRKLQLDAALKYLKQETKWYEEASDTEREAVVEDLRKEFKQKRKRSLSPEQAIQKYEEARTEEARELGYEGDINDIYNRDNEEGVTVDETKALTNYIKRADKAGKDVSKLKDKLIQLVKAKIKGVNLSRAEQNKILSLLKGEKEAVVERVPDGTTKSGKPKYKDEVILDEETVNEINEIIENRRRKDLISWIEQNAKLDKYTTKKGVGTIDVDSQRALSEYLKDKVIGSDLRGYTTEELIEIKEVVESVVSEGRKKVAEEKYKEKVTKAETQGKIISETKKDSPATELSNVEEVEMYVGADKENLDGKTQNPLDVLELKKSDEKKLEEVEQLAIDKYEELGGEGKKELPVDPYGNRFEVEKTEDGSYNIELVEDYTIPSSAREAKASVEVKLPENEVPSQADVDKAFKTKITEALEKLASGEINDAEYAVEAKKLNDAKKSIEKRIRQEEALEKLEKIPSRKAVVIVTTPKGPLAIKKSNVDILTKEDVDASNSKGYEIEAKAVPIETRKAKIILHNIKTVSTLLSDVKAKFPQLSEQVDKIEQGIIQGRYDQIEQLNEINKEIKKARTDAGVTTLKLAKKPAVTIQTNAKGEKVNITNDVVVDMYMTYKAEGSKRLEQSGVDVKALNEYMSTQPKLKEYADNLFEFYEKNSERFREVYEEIMNKDWDEVRLDPEGNKRPYLPIKGTGKPSYNDFTATEQGLTSEGETGSTPNDQSSNPMVSHFFDKNSQFVYNEKTGEYDAGGGEIIFEGASSKAASWAENMTHTENMYQVYKDVQELINADTKADLIEALGPERYNELVKRLHKSLNPGSEAAFEERAIFDSMNQFQIAWMIGSKVSQIPKQLTSTFIWLGTGIDLGVYPQDVLAQTINPKNLSKENLTFMWEVLTSPQIKERLLRSSIDPSLKNILYKKSPTGLGVKDLNILTKLYIKAALSPTLVGDYLGVMTLGVPFALAYKAKLRTRVNPDTGELYTESEAADVAKRKFYELYNKYQQSGETWASSSLSEEIMGKILVMPYKSSQTAIYNGYVRYSNILKQAKKDPSSVTGGQVAQAIVGVVTLAAAQAAFNVVAGGTLADFLGVSDADDEVKERNLHDWLWDTVQSNIDGLGYIGLGVNAFLNYMRGRDAFVNIPTTKWIQDMAKTGKNYWTFEQELQDKLDHTIYAMGGIEGYRTPFGEIMGENMEEKMAALVEARDNGDTEKALKVFKQNIEDRKAILEDIGYDLTDETEGTAYRKELAKIEKDENSLKEFAKYSSALGALGAYFDKGGNFTESIDALTGKSDFWKSVLNAKDSKDDLFPNDDAIFKWETGKEYKIKEKMPQEVEEAIEEQKEAWKDEFRDD